METPLLLVPTLTVQRKLQTPVRSAPLIPPRPKYSIITTKCAELASSNIRRTQRRKPRQQRARLPYLVIGKASVGAASDGLLKNKVCTLERMQTLNWDILPKVSGSRCQVSPSAGGTRQIGSMHTINTKAEA